MIQNNRRLAYPYIVWISIMILIPMFLVLLYSIVQTKDGNPISFQLTLAHYKAFFTELNLKILYKSFRLAFITTIVTIILGYPLAYIIARLPNSSQSKVLLFFILPMWINMLLRTYAWQTILDQNGVLANFLKLFGMTDVELIYTDFSVVLGMVYNFIPFMVLPIYTAIIKVDKNLLEAATDLGANKLQRFRKITLPLTIPGVVTGTVMVFLPAISSFTIPRLLGGGDYILIGSLVEKYFLKIGNWNFGSAISIIIMLMILVSIYVLKYFDKDNESGGALPW